MPTGLKHTELDDLEATAKESLATAGTLEVPGEITKSVLDEAGDPTYDPAIAKTAPAPDKVVAVQADAPTYDVNSNMLVSEGIKNLTGGDSEYMKAARSRGVQFAASRGLQNSSIAGTAGESAAISAALPIATSDALAYQTAAQDNQRVTSATDIANMKETNAVNTFNADLKSTVDRWNAGEFNDAEQFLAGLQAQVDMFNTGEGNKATLQRDLLQAQLDRFIADGKNDLNKFLAGLDQDIVLAQLGINAAADLAAESEAGLNSRFFRGLADNIVSQALTEINRVVLSYGSAPLDDAQITQLGATITGIESRAIANLAVIDYSELGNVFGSWTYNGPTLSGTQTEGSGTAGSGGSGGGSSAGGSSAESDAEDARLADIAAAAEERRRKAAEDAARLAKVQAEKDAAQKVIDDKAAAEKASVDSVSNISGFDGTSVSGFDSITSFTTLADGTKDRQQSSYTVTGYRRNTRTGGVYLTQSTSKIIVMWDAGTSQWRTWSSPARGSFSWTS